MKFTKILVFILVVMVLVVSVTAAEGDDPFSLDGFEAGDVDLNDDERQELGKIKTKIANIIFVVQSIAMGIAVLLAVITGIQFMGARDPVEKKQLGDRLKYVIIGLAIVVLSYPIVNVIL